MIGVEESVRKKRKRKWLGKEKRVGNGGGGGGVPEGYEGMKAAMERERMESFWEVKSRSKSAELGKMAEEGRERKG